MSIVRAHTYKQAASPALRIYIPEELTHAYSTYQPLPRAYNLFMHFVQRQTAVRMFLINAAEFVRGSNTRKIVILTCSGRD